MATREEIKAKKEAKEAAKLSAAREKEFERFRDRVHNMTGHVAARLKAAVITEAFESGKTAEEFSAEVASAEPVGKVIHTLKAEAMKNARDAAEKRVAEAFKKLEEAGWDVNVVAPYPSSSVSFSDYKRDLEKYKFYSEITRGVKSTWHPKEPHIVKTHQEGIDRYVNRCEAFAAEQYDMFICKMVSKVGECDSASIEGNHIWGWSFLTVKKGDVTEVWKTQQIVNYSSLGTAFPQWPSRIVKEKK